MSVGQMFFDQLAWNQASGWPWHRDWKPPNIFDGKQIKHAVLRLGGNQGPVLLNFLHL
jgi:hypothetical protein